MRIKKYISHLNMKIIEKLKSSKFTKFNVSIKYYLKKKKSDELIVIFSSCTRKGVKARYNYIDTLKNVKKNQLYILDNYGDDMRGVYYLGQNNNFNIEKAVTELIKEIVKKNKINKLTFIGSSKGGYAALLFGSKFKKSEIIVGAPQYYLAKYLNDTPMIHILNYILGEITEKKLMELNQYLHKAIVNSDRKSKILIHCSINEMTYNDHVKYLLNDLDVLNIKYEFDKGEYINHDDVGIAFSKILKNRL